VNAHNTRKLNTPWYFFLVVGFTLLLTLLVLPLYGYKVHQKLDYTDFEVYYRAAQRVKALQWDDVYTLKDGASPFRYAPVFLPLFRPFAELPLQTAKLLWFFLQYVWFGLAFFCIFLSLRACQNRHQKNRAIGITCFSILFVLRFCLDTFTIGQVSSLMLLGFSFGLYSWVLRRPRLSALGLVFPTVFKIGPGFLYGCFIAGRPLERKRAFKTALIAVVLWTALSTLWLGSWALTKTLWANWVNIVRSDSQYYDASHYGSQSLKSFLLRGVNSGWFNSQLADQIYFVSLIAVCAGILLFWALRRPKSRQGRGLFFSLGLFAYLWLMPETFKYSLTALAIPVAFLIQVMTPACWFGWFSLGFGVMTLSLAGKDIVGDTFFFQSQHNSIPLAATVLLAISVFREAWKNSVPSSYARALFKIINPSDRILEPWKTLPELNRTLEASLLIPLPLQSGSPLTPSFARKIILESQFVLQQCTLGPGQTGFEILVIPYGNRLSDFHPVLQEIRQLQTEVQTLQILAHPGFDGRGAVLRTGFLASRGKKILFSQIEQPCNPQFFKESLPLLDHDFDLVRANRRFSQSRFNIPVKHLSLVYQRHRLGLAFNRLVRTLLPIQTNDTHSGTIALTWQLASQIFSTHTSPDFLFDLEVCLISRAQGYREKDLPVSLSLAGEKSFQRMGLETVSIIQGLPTLAWRYKKGFYHRMVDPKAITADDWGISPGVNDGILKLAQQGVIRRVSIMANCKFMHYRLNELLAVKTVDLGIHFNLTYGRSAQTEPDLSLPLLVNTGRFRGTLIPSPGAFLKKWVNPKENRKAMEAHVREELSQQLAILKAAGIPIRYLDGHHHIHLVPGLMDVIADLVQAAGIKQVRLPYDPSLWLTKKIPLLLMSIRARSRLKHYRFEFRPCIYPRVNDFSDPKQLRYRLIQNPEAEVIVHPAEKDDIGTLEIPDSYTAGRVTEFRALQMLGFKP
jgi:predicted glycoside hydrolase/deacetylase ChbG (UPF0249 family)